MRVGPPTGDTVHGRRLATTNEVVCITAQPDGDAVDRLVSWTTTHGIDLVVRSVGSDVTADDYAEPQETLGVAIGGDGTFLEAVRALAPHRIPIVGVNGGTLAFLARIQPRDMDAALTEVLRGRASVHDRQQLRAVGAGLDATGVNDVMIQPTPPDRPVDRKICRLHAFVDREYAGLFDGSGLAINTPTGSTGLALSAGGPVHHPNDNLSLQLTPLHAHTVGVRPMVVSANAEITVVPEDRVRVLVDGGRRHATAGDGDVLTVTGADRPAHVVRTSYDNSFTAALSAKLGWSARDPGDTGPTGYLPAVGGSDDFPANACRVAREAARSAGEPLRELHGQIERVEYKSDKADVVTEADHQSDRIIATAIANEFPRHAIRSEEATDRPGSGGSPYTWLVDPLDGTGNFAHGNPNYAVSVALIDGDGEPAVGVVYSPETDEMFHAIAGRGAYRGDTPIAPTARERLDESMLLSGYDPDGGFLRAFYQATRGVRRLGSAALNLCYVAAGSADALWEYDTYPWDVAAGLLILREAGGRATDAAGGEYGLRLDDPVTADEGEDQNESESQGESEGQGRREAESRGDPDDAVAGGDRAGDVDRDAPLTAGERSPLLASNGPLHPALLDGLPDAL